MKINLETLKTANINPLSMLWLLGILPEEFNYKSANEFIDAIKRLDFLEETIQLQFIVGDLIDKIEELRTEQVLDYYWTLKPYAADYSRLLIRYAELRTEDAFDSFLDLRPEAKDVYELMIECPEARTRKMANYYVNSNPGTLDFFVFMNNFPQLIKRKMNNED